MHEQSYRLVSAAAVLVALLLATSEGTHAQRVLSPLFSSAPASMSGTARDARGQQRGVMRARHVVVDVSRVRGEAADRAASAEGTSLLLNLFEDTSFVADLDRLEPAAGGAVWVGHIPGVELSNVTLSTVDGVMTGTVAMPGAIYSIRYAGGGVHEVMQIDQAQFPRDRDAIVVRQGGGASTLAADAAIEADNGATIDLMVVYTAAARTAAGGSSAIASLINAGISNTNTSYSNSRVAQRVRLVQSAEVAYVEGDMNTDLSNLKDGAGALSGVAAMRSASGADLVMLVGSWPSQFCGLSYAMADVNATFAQFAFSLVDQSCISGNYSFAHELGHNMGMNHDWYVDNSLQPYTYAHGYAYPAGRWRTMMAYNDLCLASVGQNCTRLLYWANPSMTYLGAPMGIAGGTRSNCPTGDPFNVSCDADDHRALNETAATVSAFRTSVSPLAAPLSLRFAATKAGAGGALIAVTPAQVVTVTTSSGSVAWTATADQPWARVTNMSGTGAASGTGTGQFLVSIVNPSNVLGGTTSATSTVSVTPSTAGQVPATVAVSLTVNLSGTASASPFGQVDTPTQGATGVVGAIGVTGWALDDVGVASVKIYRNCLAFENQANCRVIAGNNVVYIGDAAFLAGARPDVEAAFPSYPQAYRAGWGYLMLTNMLPHVPRGQAYGGQGALTFYAFAADAEGQLALLGRSYVDHVPTTITLANDTIAKPFGAIDTPGQGQTVSGVIANFGWALTPDSNTTADSGDILIPVNGSTMNVFIDGVAAGAVTYNQCRGSVGNPVPAGVYCDDDVASIFGNTTPRATFTPRSSNPTRYRNLDAGRGAIGAFSIDTRTLANGMHTIAWGVTDSAGRPEGIGSRFFTVLNSGAADAGAAQDLQTATAAALRDAPALVRGSAAAVEVLPASTTEVLARTGFDLQTPFEPLVPGTDGVRQVQLPEMGRLELQLGRVESGHLLANGTLRDLPAGAHLDATEGLFTWTPGVGYIGTYRLVFVAGGAQTTVVVTVRPEVSAPAGQSEVRMFVDLPAPSQVVPSSFVVAGWALDPRAAMGGGIGAVHVWARRLDAIASAPVFLGAADLGGSRPDVARAFGEQFGQAGFGLTASGLAPGRYEITAFAWNRRTARWEDARSVFVTVR